MLPKVTYERFFFFFIFILYTWTLLTLPTPATEKKEFTNTDANAITNKKTELTLHNYVSLLILVSNVKRNVPIPFEFRNGTVISGLTLQGTYNEGGKDLKYRFHVMPTTTNPTFLITLPNIQTELLSTEIYTHGEFERATNRIFESIQRSGRGCHHIKDGAPPLVLDVGANLGWFTAFSSASGCRVIGIEPQPRLLSLINMTLELNEYSDLTAHVVSPKYSTIGGRAVVYNNIVSDTKNRVKIVYDNGKCWACSSVKIIEENEVVGKDEYVIPSIRLDEVIKEDVLIMKVDVESFEVRALESALPALAKYDVANIIVEWFPRRWQWNGVSVERGTALLENLSKMGYGIYIYSLNLQYNVTGLKRINVGNSAVWEITRDQIQHLNEYHMDKSKSSYGEANLWLTKDILVYM